jgi:hypothetical protein
MRVNQFARGARRGVLGLAAGAEMASLDAVGAFGRLACPDYD